jgi:hypothetical protein
MIKIDYPDHEFRIKEADNTKMIFDEIRKTWLKLTPEEWVRQNFIQYLIKQKKYPSTLIAQEKQIMVGEMLKRFDILIYSREHRPWMMVECKSMQVPLTEEVFNQVLRYNIGVPVQYLVITNGVNCMAFEKRNMQLAPLKEIPGFA